MTSPRHCPECGQPFTRKRHDQSFCSPECRFEDHNRAMRRGREAYRAIYHWRLGQGKGQRGSLIGVISAMGKAWVEEDRAKGRGAPPFPEELVMRRINAKTGYVKERGGQRYVKDHKAAEAVLTELAHG
jgi:predicted nucleic acid-binding Zn ribbon protein